MAKVELYYGKKQMNHVISHIEGVGRSTYEEANKREHYAAANLAEVRATTTHSKIHGPDHLTSTSSQQSFPDALFSLDAPNAVAIEFGHDPSGVFAGTDSKPPQGLYILTKAAYE